MVETSTVSEKWKVIVPSLRLMEYDKSRGSIESGTKSSFSHGSAAPTVIEAAGFPAVSSTTPTAAAKKVLLAFTARRSNCFRIFVSVKRR